MYLIILIHWHFSIRRHLAQYHSDIWPFKSVKLNWLKTLEENIKKNITCYDFGFHSCFSLTVNYLTAVLLFTYPITLNFIPNVSHYLQFITEKKILIGSPPIQHDSFDVFFSKVKSYFRSTIHQSLSIPKVLSFARAYCVEIPLTEKRKIVSKNYH